MINVTKNLDNIIAQAINGPKVDGIPLYTRIDGSQEVGFNNKVGNKSDLWIKASINNYTSPTNIKRIFITGKKVIIQMYKPPIIKGKHDSKGCWREFKFENNNNLLDWSLKILNYSQYISQYYMEKQINKDVKEPEKITIKGTGLKAISHPWVCSNIEEVYFDWTILTSETYMKAGIGCNELLKSYITGKRGYINTDLALQMFKMANTTDIKDIRTRFPRLKLVSFISELGKILEDDYDKGKPGLDSIEDSITPWWKLDKNIELIKQSNSLIIYNKLDDKLPLYNKNFSLRDGIYKFDSEILKDYFSNYERRVKEHIINISNEETKVVTEKKTEKSELEILLDDVETKKGIGDSKIILMLTLDGVAINDIKAIFEEMSTDGQIKYKELIGWRD